MRVHVLLKHVRVHELIEPIRVQLHVFIKPIKVQEIIKPKNLKEYSK